MFLLEDDEEDDDDEDDEEDDDEENLLGRSWSENWDCEPRFLKIIQCFFWIVLNNWYSIYALLQYLLYGWINTVP